MDEPQVDDTRSLLTKVRDGYHPYQVVALSAPDDATSAIPLPQDRGLGEERATTYVCVGVAGQAPVTEPQPLGVCLEKTHV